MSKMKQVPGLSEDGARKIFQLLEWLEDCPDWVGEQDDLSEMAASWMEMLLESEGCEGITPTGTTEYEGKQAFYWDDYPNEDQIHVLES